ncbi:hypothetical protein ONZ45_g11425 [Pleurotus djamor]|nr:hypothetical protein ONZ45_g11425 [Pleurotus djamor]
MSDTNLHDVALDEQYMDVQSTAAETRCEKTRPVEGDLPTGFVNKLSPPAGTDYWRCKPDDPNFVHNGGAVYVVLVHSGSAALGSTASAGMEHCFDVFQAPSVGGSAGAAMKQLPTSNSGTKNGDVTSYPLSFIQDMQMFRSNGNETFTFSAQYEDGLDIHKGQQTGFVNGSSATHWHLKFESAVPGDNFPVTALSVFRFPSFSKVTFDCKAWIGYVAPELSVTRSITVDCCF